MAGDLEAGDRILMLDSRYGTAEALEVVERVQAMYDLTVAEAHTFAVGDGEWVVHNINCPLPRQRDARGLSQIANEIKELYRRKHGAYANATFGVARNPANNTLTLSIGASENNYDGIARGLTEALNGTSYHHINKLPRPSSFISGNHHAEQQLYDLFGNEVGQIGISQWKGLCPGCEANFTTRNVVVAAPPDVSAGHDVLSYNLFYMGQKGTIGLLD